VGKVIVGPAPQINLPGFAGDKKNVGLRSPIPKALAGCENSDGWLMIGRMVRVIRFQLSLNRKGITGWTFMIQIVSCLLPAPKLNLFWKGTLMRSALGFCVFFASPVSLSSAANAGGIQSIAIT